MQYTFAGISTLALLPYFSSVTGIDPSESMISKALRDPNDASLPAALRPHPLQADSAEVKLTGASHQVGKLGELSYLQDSAMTLEKYLERAAGSGQVPEEAKLDLIISAQASHWLTPYSSLLPLLNRVLRPKGSLVFFGYSEFFIPKYPSLSPLISTYSNGKAPPHKDDAIGEYWERPGRTIVDQGLTAIPFPWEEGSGVDPKEAQSTWSRESGQRRVFSTAGLASDGWDEHWASQDPLSESERRASSEFSMSKMVTWETFAGYLNTWSSLRNYMDAVPDDAAQFGGGKEDVSQRFLRRIKEAMLEAEKQRNGSDVTLPEEFEIRWPLHVYAVKKK